MRISHEWLSEWVESLPAPDELAEQLTRLGLEVEASERLGEGLDRVVVGEVLRKEPVAGSDKLHLCSVEVGAGEPLSIVCGASNYEVGAKVPTALVGAVLPGDFRIEARKVMGVPSHGMLCSGKELGIEEDASGLLLLEAEAVPGTPIVEQLGLRDVVLTLNATPNRPDWLSHLGVAREIVALGLGRLRIPPAELTESGARVEELASIEIEAQERCARYAARVVEGVRFGPSPRWMQRRLRACGVRPLGNLIDVTNYVLLEAGHPLHAFDLDRVEGGIVVRTARPGERMTTLDGKERRLDPDDLLIADQVGPLVLAGVMGGQRAEVGEGTQRVLIESAWFAPSGIRRSARRHALHSESSHRFERGADPEAVRWSLDRAARLMTELAGGAVRSGVLDLYPGRKETPVVRLRHERVGRLLGTSVEAAESRRVLVGLGFEVAGETEGATDYRVPSFRVDVTREADLIEEVARVRGYDTIPLRLPASGAQPPADDRRRQVLARVQDALGAAGLDETVHLAFADRADLEALRLGDPALALANPLAATQSVMRTSLLPALLRTLAFNRNRGAERLRLWEHGKVFRAVAGKDQPVEEPRRVAGVLWGARHPATWAHGRESVDFYDLKGCVEALLLAVGIEESRWLPGTAAHLHPRSACSVQVGEVELGSIGELHPEVAEAFDLPRGVFVFELSLDALEDLARLEPSYRPFSRLPAVLRDLAVVVPRELPAAAVEAVLRGPAGKGLVEHVELFDVYEGAQLGEGRKSLAFAIRYRASDRTLTDDEVAAVHQALLEALQKEVGAELRS